MALGFRLCYITVLSGLVLRFEATLLLQVRRQTHTDKSVSILLNATRDHYGLPGPQRTNHTEGTADIFQQQTGAAAEGQH